MRRRSPGERVGPVVLCLILAGCAAGGRATRGETTAPTHPTSASANAPTGRSDAATADAGRATVTAPSTLPAPEAPLAPELEADAWLNSEPLTLAQLRGKVVIIEFWTYG